MATEYGTITIEPVYADYTPTVIMAIVTGVLLVLWFATRLLSQFGNKQVLNYKQNRLILFTIVVSAAISMICFAAIPTIMQGEVASKQKTQLRILEGGDGPQFDQIEFHKGETVYQDSWFQARDTSNDDWVKRDLVELPTQPFTYILAPRLR